MLSDEELRDALRACPSDCHEPLRTRWLYAKDFARAIESAATAPLLARIAELERELEEARKDAGRWRHVVNHATIDCDAFFWSKNGRGIDYANYWVDKAIKEQT